MPSVLESQRQFPFESNIPTFSLSINISKEHSAYPSLSATPSEFAGQDVSQGPSTLIYQQISSSDAPTIIPLVSPRGYLSLVPTGFPSNSQLPLKTPIFACDLPTVMTSQHIIAMDSPSVIPSVVATSPANGGNIGFQIGSGLPSTLRGTVDPSQTPLLFSGQQTRSSGVSARKRPLSGAVPAPPASQSCVHVVPPTFQGIHSMETPRVSSFAPTMTESLPASVLPSID